MKGKIVKNTLDTIVNVLSNKNTEEAKDYSRKRLLKSTPFFATGGTLHLLEVTSSTPLEVLNLFSQYNVEVGSAYFALYGVGSLLMLSSNPELPIQDELAQYGSEYCPYESFNVANNDLKAKSLQMKINTLHNLSYKLGGKSLLGGVTKKVANISESAIASMGENSKKLFDFFGKGELGFELLTHKNNNPRLIQELPVPSVFKEILNPQTMDLDNQYKIEERKLVFEIRERAMLKTRESINERNVYLAIVKVIDKVKSETVSIKDLRILNKLLDLNKQTSKGTLEKYKGVSDLVKFVTKDAGIDEIRKMNIPKWNARQSLGVRTYHILNELNKIAFENKIDNVRNPMLYREVYRNNLIMSIQFKMRISFEQENVRLNNAAPLVKDHFIKTHKNYFKDLSKFSIVKMKGITIDDYPAIKYAKEDKIIDCIGVNLIDNKTQIKRKMRR